LARDYVTINDTRPGSEIVMRMWFVPELIPPESPNAATVKALLDKIYDPNGRSRQVGQSNGQVLV
jgi:hypothetical protein